MKAMITRKVGMTNTISEDGAVSAVTLLSIDNCRVVGIKTKETDGYNALQIGCGEAKNPKNPQIIKNNKSKPLPVAAVIREIRCSDEPNLSVGDQINADIFSINDKVEVVGTAKGKGFAGTIKRHNFSRQRKTHGAKGATRRPGSIGSMYPQKIFKGKKMAGRMGGQRVTVKNLKVALVDNELGVIGVNGAVPGPKKGIVIIRGVDNA